MNESQETKTDKQTEKQFKPWLFKPGQSGNPNGRPKGKTLKEWTRNKLMELDETERAEFLKFIPRDIVWKMAEGMPKQDIDQKTESEVKHIISIDE